MRSLTSVIFVSPGTELNPITSQKYPKFTLPILNEPLLLHNLRWIGECSEEIIIVYLQKYHESLTEILQNFEYDKQLTLRGIEQYDGTFFNLKQVVKNIKSTNVLVFKGDIITTIPFISIFEYFLYKKTDVFVILKKDTKNFSVIGTFYGKLLFYSDDQGDNIPKHFTFDHPMVKFTKNSDLAQVYIFKRKFLENLEGDYFSIKTNLIPHLIKKYPIDYCIIDEDFYQVQRYDVFITATNFLRLKSNNLPFYLYESDIKEDPEKTELTFDNYNKQNINFIFKTKNRISFPEDQNIVGKYLTVDQATIKKSVIGNYCTINTGCSIDESLILNNVTIGANCRLIRCFIGNNVNIPANSSLKDCKVIHDYVAEKEMIGSEKVYIP